MTTFTAEDFAKARFAERDDGRFAARLDPDYRSCWDCSDGLSFSDEDMAATGWTPVREAATVSLDALHTAWENAEQADKCRKGDVLIRQDAYEVYGGYAVYPATVGSPLTSARILSRAPQREPWADLADDLAEVLDVDARCSEELARDLHNGGWRKGGEES